MGGPHFRPALLVFFLGGLTTNWVGFELLLKEHALGLSERRAAWFVSWARNTANSKVVHTRGGDTSGSFVEREAPHRGSMVLRFSCLIHVLSLLGEPEEQAFTLCAAEAREESIAPLMHSRQTTVHESGAGSRSLAQTACPVLLFASGVSQEITVSDSLGSSPKILPSHNFISRAPCLPLPYHYLGCCSLRRGAVCYHGIQRATPAHKNQTRSQIHREKPMQRKTGLIALASRVSTRWSLSTTITVVRSH